MFKASRSLAAIALILISSRLMPAQNPAANNDLVRLDSSETLFTVLAAINNCGFDAELATSDPLRMAIRGEIGQNVELSGEAKISADAFCAFYRDHQQPDPVRTQSQYVSLALYLNGPPAFSPKVKESDLPPDASALLGAVPLLGKFYQAAGLKDIWKQHSSSYAEIESRYRDALAKMISDTELYLRLPTGGYLGRGFTIYVEPMGAPSEIDARNYGSEYYVVVSPGKNAGLKIEQIRHTYLHYLLDPMIGKYAVNLNALEPILDAVKLAPMDESFKADPVLLATECVIRSIEARAPVTGKASLSDQEHAVDESMAQGFVLTRYFYERLLDFEKDTIGFRNSLPPMLAQIDVRKEQKRASQIQFASAADPELLQLPRPKEASLLKTAAERLSAGDSATAEKLAKQALAEKTEDPGRALFLLAQISASRKDSDGARDYFEQALKATNEPKVVAWSNIYLGRIFDLQDDNENGPDRAQAIAHYKAAAGASDDLPEAKAAAEQGLQKPYAAPKQAGDAQEGQSPEDDKN
jgi:tetratricopeptide (TPR) repeat protein